jgi:hypothetical protein
MSSPGVSLMSNLRLRVPPLDELAIKLSPFDDLQDPKLIRASEETILNVVQRIAPALELKSALDAGAGVVLFLRLFWTTDRASADSIVVRQTNAPQPQ